VLKEIVLGAVRFSEDLVKDLRDEVRLESHVPTIDDSSPN
jgi:hypothetical protein